MRDRVGWEWERWSGGLVEWWSGGLGVRVQWRDILSLVYSCLWTLFLVLHFYLLPASVAFVHCECNAMV